MAVLSRLGREAVGRDAAAALGVLAATTAGLLLEGLSGFEGGFSLLGGLVGVIAGSGGGVPCLCVSTGLAG